jgi:hypothetical protein
VVRESCLVALDAADYWGHNANNTSSPSEDGNGKEAKVQAEDGTHNFAHQKADKRILLNHFNVKE